MITIDSDELAKLYSIFKLPKGDKAALLDTLQSEFSGNKAYSMFGEFLDKNAIKYTRSTWS